jgi:hypothetical protein
MSYICCLWGFIEPSKSLGGKYEPSEKFRGQKQTLFFFKTSHEERQYMAASFSSLFFKGWIEREKSEITLFNVILDV